MVTIRDKVEGNKVFKSDTELFGMVTGSAQVLAGVELKMYGMICGSLTLDQGSSVELRGTVSGDVVNNGGTLSVYGIVYGRVISKSGKTMVDKKAVVTGGVA